MRLASVVSRLNYRRETKILEVLILKRFKVQTADGHTLLLYYPTQEKAQESYPDATITEHTDQSHVEYIERMLAAANDCKTAERKGSTVYLLRFNTSAGICLAMLSRDISDGMWYDLCQYQFWKSGALVAPITKTLSNPAAFCKQFLFPKSEYQVLCAGGKLPKPEEIRGVRKFASVPFEGICQCQLFLKGDDLYIKHNDYFSEMHSTGKIDPRTNMEERVLYIRHAWLRITNFVPLVKLLNDVEISSTVWPMLRDFHQWPAGEYNMEWNRFLEGVARATRNYLSKKEVGYGTENL